MPCTPWFLHLATGACAFGVIGIHGHNLSDATVRDRRQAAGVDLTSSRVCGSIAQ
jgi:hypothetical protein